MSEPDLPPPVVPPSNDRHGCLLALLIAIIVVYAILAVTSLLAIPVLGFSMAIVALCAVANVVFAVMLFQWKRIGFYGFVASSVVGVVMNIIAGQTLSGIVGAAIGIGLLYWVLNMGGERKAWPRLK